jgi:hypothetical protein
MMCNKEREEMDVDRRLIGDVREKDEECETGLPVSLASCNQILLAIGA